jgi:SAM-dependent methyltransferase
LVASDPLYIADIDSEFVDNTVQKFTPEYQARLRRYLIDITNYNISNLPTGQFNFIFSFNFFNYLSLDSIKQLLKRAMIWLRPGGVILFTYNNADMSPSAGLSESYFMTYVPKSLLIPLVESLGYEVVTSRDFHPSTSWIEIKKPGTLSTVKAHQALGEIKYR